MSIAEYTVLYYGIFCVSGALVCTYKIFIPAMRLIRIRTQQKFGWLPYLVTGVIFIALCLFIGPAMLLILKNEDEFIENYANRYMGDE
jgi:hypothetical protein|tara:strand:- start:1733 stop:1996 length:264 start_codon:yes stop_codon:yes gene_type:complete